MTDETCDSLPDQPPATMPGLVLVPTPLGNLGDMTTRAVEALRGADLVLCEDTRVSARLLAHFDIRARTRALHDHNEEDSLPGLLAMLRDGKRIALISDAGTPLVSDPGFRLARAAIAEGLPVHALPGANAAVLALTLSGLPPQPFLFLGFPPPKSAARRAAFATIAAAERAGLRATLVWYEAPHRVGETLADLHATLGEREAALCREMTKRFEEVVRAPLSALAARYAGTPPRGEITLVVAPAEDAPPEVDLDAALRAALARARLKEAVAEVTAATGLPRREVYARALLLTRGDH